MNSRLLLRVPWFEKHCGGRRGNIGKGRGTPLRVCDVRTGGTSDAMDAFRLPPGRLPSPAYEAAFSATALGVCPDFLFLRNCPRPSDFASADLFAAYCGATIG